MEFLSFAKPEKRISFAASFGGDMIHENIDSVAKYLKQMKRISVREESGVDIVKKISGRDAVHLVDPTFMINTEAWDRLSKKPEKIEMPDKYVLTYFLGEKNRDVYDALSSIDSNIPVINLKDLNQPDIFVSGPSEFLYLFSHASLILTDSFHGCAFSFIYNKPFLVFDRKGDTPNMMARVTSLLKLFHLERKYTNSGLPNDIWEHDYTEGYKQLEIERKKTMDFLKKALED